MSLDEKKNELKILVVDDIASARKVTVRLLNRLGFNTCTECEGVADSVEKLKSDSFDLMISDVNLKDGKGTDIIKQLGENSEILASLRSIFITSDIDKKSFLDSIDCKATSYLLKPFSPTSLEEKIKVLYGEA